MGHTRLCIADRLQAFKNLWEDGCSLRTLPFIQLPEGIDPQWLGVADGFVPSLTNNSSDLILWRPSFPSKDAPEERREIPGVMSHLPTSPLASDMEMGALAMDLSQDVLAFSRPAQPNM